jgi:hypothetical protein
MLNHRFENKDTESICKKYGINKREFDGMQNEIGTFYSDVRIQHLSSIMRSLEIKGRYITKNNSFRIDWEEMENDSNDTHSMWKDGRFIIFLPKNIEDDEQARYIVAHELGELFYILDMIEKKLTDEKQIKDEETKKYTREAEIEMLIREECKKPEIKAENHKKANIFGIVVIQERSDFYKTKVLLPEGIIRKTLDKTVEDVMKYFN